MLSRLAGVIAAWVFVGAAAWAKPAPDGFAPLVEKLSPSVVNISTEKPLQNAADRAPVTMPFALQKSAAGNGSRSLGSGFVIDAAGLIVTNNHVIDGASEILVGFQDGTRRGAVVVGRDAKTDIALLKVTGGKAPPAAFGDSDAAKAGDWVLAIGNPFGLGGSVSAGIISARNRQLEAEIYDDFIQTDAAINHGNSGGPLFDMDGRVIGVNSAMLSPNGGSIGISFAIPSNTVKTVVAQLKQYGHVRRGWIGANVQDVGPGAKGALIGHVTPGGPAAGAGLRAGDVVTRIDGKEVSDSRAMQKLIVESAAGRKLDVGLVRGGQARALSVRVGRRSD